MPCDKKRYRLMTQEDIHKMDEEAYQYGEDHARTERMKKKIKGILGFGSL